MISRVGTIGHTRVTGIGAIDGMELAAALIMAARLPASERKPDAAQTATTRIQLTEREQWNHDVEQRKGDKLAKKVAQK